MQGSKDIWLLSSGDTHPLSHSPLQICSTPVQVENISFECLIQCLSGSSTLQSMHMVWDKALSDELQHLNSCSCGLEMTWFRKAMNKAFSVAHYENTVNFLARQHKNWERFLYSHALLHCIRTQSLGPKHLSLSGVSG